MGADACHELTRDKSVDHNADEGHEGKPDKCVWDLKTPADLAGPASPGRDL
jgi:hypothetical protein